MKGTADGERLLRLIFRDLKEMEADNEPFTAGDVLTCCCKNSLEIESVIEDCIGLGGRHGQRRKGNGFNAKTLGLYLRTLVGKRLGDLQLEASYDSHVKCWLYEIGDYTPAVCAHGVPLDGDGECDLCDSEFEAKSADYDPVGDLDRRLQLAPMGTLKQLDKQLNKIERDRKRNNKNFAKLKAWMVAEAAKPKDWRGTVKRVKREPWTELGVSATPAPAPLPVPPPPPPDRCIYGGRKTGRYLDGRCKGCGRRHT